MSERHEMEILECPFDGCQSPQPCFDAQTCLAEQIQPLGATPMIDDTHQARLDGVEGGDAQYTAQLEDRVTALTEQVEQLQGRAERAEALADARNEGMNELLTHLSASEATVAQLQTSLMGAREVLREARTVLHLLQSNPELSGCGQHTHAIASVNAALALKADWPKEIAGLVMAVVMDLDVPKAMGAVLAAYPSLAEQASGLEPVRTEPIYDGSRRGQRLMPPRFALRAEKFRSAR